MKMNEKNKITDEELNNVAGGRTEGAINGAANLILKYNLVECKCKYCGKTKHILEADPLYH